MLGILLIIVGCYAVAALLVHVLFRISRGRGGRARHYVFIADETQPNMEWHMRSLFSFSRWMGKDVSLTVVDRGLDEESRAIIQHWSRSGNEVRVHAGQKEGLGAEKIRGSEHHHEESVQMMWHLKNRGIVSETEQAVLIDLQNPADLSKMPF